MRARLPLAVRALRAYFRTGLRGQTRITAMLARHFKTLQAVPIQIADWPAIYMDLRLDDTHQWLKGSPWFSSPREVDEQAVMRRVVKPGDVVLDIGANVGLHTVLLSRLVGPAGKVVAFEPNAGLLPTLRKTVAGLGNATLYAVALSDEATQATLFVPSADQSLASLADWTHELVPGGAERLTCDVRRLDEVIDDSGLPFPNFIKCDVEGAESKVFLGGQRALNRTDAPILLYEENVNAPLGFGLPASATRAFLTGLRLPRYQFFEVQAGGTLAPAYDVKPVLANILAVPEASMALLS